ncbi:putative NUXM subunit of mitochondrial NADH:ubiquinone oxidoreductase [Dipodascopsis tothii]|uniref:putative NUXM subunit of mitochondrial NADH:ubiquinone oxidoreductase n=1 Tax=Dipodascopsis tothii TaxID=44089 RepID=UPI0034CDC939
MASPVKPAPAAYEIIDTDPHMSRVVRYMRFSDLVTGTAVAVGGPAFLLALQHIDPTSVKGARTLAPTLRAAGALGLFAGFSVSYLRSSRRFWGWDENAREVAKDRYEMKSRLAKGEPLYPTSQTPSYLQDLAARYTTYSATMLAVFPIFNLAHHQTHGIDPARYYEVRDGEEDWPFDLQKDE